MTVGVYGLVAGIVKLDDLGLWLSRTGAAARRATGRAILRTAPWLMKALSLAGTAAMFLVGGSILTHGVPPLEHAVEHFAEGLPGIAGALVPLLVHAVVGIVAGGVVMAGVALARRTFGRRAAA
jgi:predicted DNA repair protein MutK